MIEYYNKQSKQNEELLKKLKTKRQERKEIINKSEEIITSEKSESKLDIMEDGLNTMK